MGSAAAAKPGGARVGSSCRRAGEGVAEWAGLEGTIFQFWICLFLRKISKVIIHLLLLIMQSMQNLTPLFSFWKLPWKTLWQKDIIVFDKLFQSHRFCVFFWPLHNSDEHQERTEFASEKKEGERVNPECWKLGEVT